MNKYLVFSIIVLIFFSCKDDNKKDDNKPQETSIQEEKLNKEQFKFVFNAEFEVEDELQLFLFDS